MMSSKGQVYAIEIVDFISKTEGPVHFEQVGTYKTQILTVCLFVHAFLNLQKEQIHDIRARHL